MAGVEAVLRGELPPKRAPMARVNTMSVAKEMAKRRALEGDGEVEATAEQQGADDTVEPTPETNPGPLI